MTFRDLNACLVSRPLITERISVVQDATAMNMLRKKNGNAYSDDVRGLTRSRTTARDDKLRKSASAIPTRALVILTQCN